MSPISRLISASYAPTSGATTIQHEIGGAGDVIDLLDPRLGREPLAQARISSGRSRSISSAARKKFGLPTFSGSTTAVVATMTPSSRSRLSRRSTAEGESPTSSASASAVRARVLLDEGQELAVERVEVGSGHRRHSSADLRRNPPIRYLISPESGARRPYLSRAFFKETPMIDHIEIRTSRMAESLSSMPGCSARSATSRRSMAKPRVSAMMMRSACSSSRHAVGRAFRLRRAGSRDGGRIYDAGRTAGLTLDRAPALAPHIHPITMPAPPRSRRAAGRVRLPRRRTRLINKGVNSLRSDYHAQKMKMGEQDEAILDARGRAGCQSPRRRRP
jgi:hypothetical protein